MSQEAVRSRHGACRQHQDHHLQIGRNKRVWFLSQPPEGTEAVNALRNPGDTPPSALQSPALLCFLGIAEA